MTYKELMRMLDRDPTLTFESKSLCMYSQTVHSLLYWQTSPEEKLSERLRYRKNITSAKDWELEVNKPVAGWARLNSYDVIVGLYPTRFLAEAPGCRVARLYLGEVEAE